MTLEPITCNNCGAVLDIPVGADFITCAACGSRLAVQRTPGGVYTEEMHPLDERAQPRADDRSQRQLQRELARIDREWAQERQQYLLRSRDGSTFEPRTPLTPFSVRMTVIVIGLLGVAIVVWPGMITSDNSLMVCLVGVVFVGMLLWGTVNSIFRANSYQRAKSAYDARRAAILQRVRGQ